MSASKSREFVFQAFYHSVFLNEDFYSTKDELKVVIDNLSKSIEAPQEHSEYIYDTLLSAQKNRNQIEDLISKHLKNWKLERVSNIDKSILILAIAEMKYTKKKTPGAVVINEYIEVAKKFGSEKSKSFVNGILDKISKLDN